VTKTFIKENQANYNKHNNTITIQSRCYGTTAPFMRHHTYKEEKRSFHFLRHNNRTSARLLTVFTKV